FEISDNQGTAPVGSLGAGSYSYGSYANNTAVEIYVTDVALVACADSAGPVTDYCTPPPPPCTVNIDSISAQCLTDSTFEVLVYISGNGSSFEITDNQGTTPVGNLSAGTYSYGSYANNTAVEIYVTDLALVACADSAGPVTADCTPPPPPCTVNIDSISAQCLTDSTFEVLVYISGNGSSFEITDNQGTTPVGNLSAGTYSYGSYANNTAVEIYVTDLALVACADSAGPVTADCTPPPPPCTVNIDSISTHCSTDSTFEIVVTFTGTGSDFEISDDQGTPAIGSLSSGTYTYGSYPNNTQVAIFVNNTTIVACGDTAGPIMTDCSPPPPPCSVNLDSVIVHCVSDSTFELLVYFTGVGSNFILSDDQGTTPIFGLSSGIYVIGPYANSTDVTVTVADTSVSGCSDSFGPVTGDCTGVPVCDLAVAPLQTTCLSDSTFGVIVSFAGTGGTAYEIYDNLGTDTLSNIGPGMYVYGSYPNNTAVTITVNFTSLFTCEEVVGPITADCTPPPPPCQVNIDSAITACLTDSTFQITVGFSGNGNNYSLSDNQGSPTQTGLVPGVYVLGPYANNTDVQITVADPDSMSCTSTFGPVTADCFVPQPCIVAIDTAYPACQTDSTFALMVQISGNGSNLSISDDQNTAALTGLTSGLYPYGEYPNGTSVTVSVNNPTGNGCSDSYSPLTEDCTPQVICSVDMDTVFAVCVTDSTFNIVVKFTGVGTNFQLGDDQGSSPLTNLAPGEHTIGPYFNSTDVIITVEDTSFTNCSFSFGPITADCTPVPICDVTVDSIFVQCLSDTTFNLAITISGSGNDYSIIDNQGLYQISNVGVGTFTMGPYVAGSSVGALVVDNRVFGCILSAGPILGDCSPPANNDCNNASPMVCGGSVTGTTINSTASLPLTCGTTPTGNGVWYTLIGNGQTIKLSTCSSTAPFDSEINVYKGNCDLMKCVAGNNDGTACPNGSSEVSFQGDIGTVYYIYVSNGLGSTGGNFTLTASCTSQTIGISIYPNPGPGNFTLSYPSTVKTKMKWVLATLEGVTVETGTEIIERGTNIIPLNFENYPEGVYFLHLITPNNPPEVLKIIIKH
ncbi:MAG: T9SS type A sorting domain-containing protein, partial [Bacteroidota bacterium]